MKKGWIVTLAIAVVGVIGLTSAWFMSLSYAAGYDNNIPTVIRPATPVTEVPAPDAPAPTTTTTAAPRPTAYTEQSEWIPDPEFVNNNPVLRDTIQYNDQPGAPTTIGPGTTITQYADEAHTKMARCTVAFTGRQSNGKNIAVTAGHCVFDPAEPVRNHDAGDTVIGRYRVWKEDSSANDSQADASGFAVIELLSNVSITSDTSFGTITGVGRARVGDKVCKYGSTTRLTCGEVSYAGDKSLVLRLDVEEGDSGGPVIRYTSPGANTFELVGNINASVSYKYGLTRALAEPLPHILSLLREHLDEDVKIYVH